MDPDTFAQSFLQFIRAEPSDPEHIKQSNLIKNNINNLGLIFQFLPQCPVSVKEMALTFVTITEILKNRGGLLDVPFLQQQINFLMTFIAEKIDFILSNPSLKNLCADAVAYSFRFLFELTIPNPPVFSSLFQTFESPHENMKILSLEIMNSLVTAIKDSKLKHLTETDYMRNVELFQKTQLSSYFNHAAHVILMNNPTLIDHALNLLVSCFKNFATKLDNADIDTYVFSAPQEIYQFYQKTDLPSALFQIFNSAPPGSNRENLAMESLIYFSSVAWRPIDRNTQLAYLFFAANTITQFMRSGRCQQDEATLLSTSRFIFKIGTIINVAMFIQGQTEVAVNFFLAVRDITIFAFNNCLMKEPSNYLIKFWGKLANTRFDMSTGIPQEFIQLFPEVFNAYVNAVCSYFNNEGECESDVEISQFLESIKHLWYIEWITPKICSQYVANVLSTLTQELVSKPIDMSSITILYRIVHVILIITAQFVGRLSPKNLEDNAILIDSILNFINITNDFTKSIIASNIEPLLGILCTLEKSLKYFTLYFKREFIGSTQGYGTTNTDRIYANLPIFQSLPLEVRRQAAFDIIFNRFLHDLENFMFNPDLLKELLEFIDDFIQKSPKDVKILVQNNALLQTLIQRKFIIEFKFFSQSVSVNKLYTILNKLYVRSILTVDQWAAFLPYFDQRFSQLASSGYSDQIMVFNLFSELNGALKGNGISTLFYYLFRWFMTHVDDTIQCIAKHSNNENVLIAICKTWTALCTNKGYKLIIPSTSAEGIKLFQSSLKVIQTLAGSDLTDERVVNIKMKYITKIIAPSLSTKYVNFGIMEYFKDTSLDIMIDIYFTVLANWSFEAYKLYPKIVKSMNAIILSILEIKPMKIADEAKLNLISRFLFKAMLQLDNSLYIKEVYQTLTKLIEFFLQSNCANLITNFQAHFLAILDQIINGSQPLTDTAAAPLYYMFLGIPGWAQHVFEMICSIFDPKNREEISALFTTTFGVIDPAKGVTQGQKDLRNILVVFKKKIKKYATNLSDIAEFEPYFLTQEPRL
ncbi:hypothetical protein TRFO_14165 [Tritrichomonas foetus]|uniref:Exportin-1 C-terminal domain-containing protein n=1 Tax=Tritrichomonas foetus TaxID=1144522 RepID=A0A1J4L0A7_9EUKA|nr:hypothetical protein TRFO_14165 [Tritrichomonas foetus]|eukprot:OHT15398.1 hypothetical protein TRFO_14165 [Tritrichomonas foetus]